MATARPVIERIRELCENEQRRLDSQRANVLLSETRGKLTTRERADLVSQLFFRITPGTVRVRDARRAAKDGESPDSSRRE